MKFDAIINERRSVRKFHPKKPDWKKIIEAIDAGNKGPLAGNIGSVKFTLVSDAEKIQEIATACQQDFVGQVHYIIVVCSDTRDVMKFYPEKGDVYIRQQAGAAIENILLKLVDLGLSTCWVGLFNEDFVKQALKIPGPVYVEAILPIGYSMDKTPRRRKPLLDNSIYFDKWGNRLMKPRKRVEAG
ncbi:MAG: nitroreductase family protein [Candidatus Pacearchaeota archaeon]|jgi:nitroreductase